MKNEAGAVISCPWTRREWLGAAVAGQAAPARLPNVLLILGDNWAWPHASAYGDPLVRTPVFDRLAKEGVLFTHAFGPTPSCSPSRASLLSGQASHRLGEGANLWGTLAARIPVYPDLLENAGYRTGFAGKGWGPGPVDRSGRRRNPAGDSYPGFEQFLEAGGGPGPFCFWLGVQSPHLPWSEGRAGKSRMDPARVRVPPHLPDHPVVRDDILNYLCEVEDLDRRAGEALEALERRGLLDNTLVVMTSDNGWQMPRGLANVYDDGVRVPMALRWGGRWAGRRVDAFVTLEDLAPTICAAAGVAPLAEATGRSLLPLCEGRRQEGRDAVFLERERHANVRRGDASYPIRAIRTRDYLYIQNLRPERWPAGDPELYFAVGPYGDIDPSPTKTLLMENRERFPEAFRLCFEKRPAEELYDLRRDPGQVRNVAGDAGYARTVRDLGRRLKGWREATADPRLGRDDDTFDAMPYYGPRRGAGV